MTTISQMETQLLVVQDRILLAERNIGILSKYLKKKVNCNNEFIEQFSLFELN